MPGPAVTVVDPLGRELDVPATPDDDRPYPGLDRPEEVRAYYVDNGYVVLRGLVDPSLCQAAHAAFEREVKPFDGFIYRQTTARPERHQLSEHGFVLNPLLNVQSLDGRHFAGFRRLALDVLTSEGMRKAAETLLGHPGQIVQTMYFEGNPATSPHQDTYYLDSEELGSMTAAWVAVEDIAPGAGRFFVCPGSHRLDLPPNAGDYQIGAHHDRYLDRVRELMGDGPLEVRAPALAQGDVLFWSSRTVHGSLATTDPRRSRRSFTAHFIPDSSRLVQFQHRVRPLHVSIENGVRVHRPKDLSRARNRAMLAAETRFPGVVAAAKKTAIRALGR